MRLRRLGLRLRAARKRRELVPVADRSAAIRPHDILLFTALRNVRTRLPHFLDYYRRLGVGHFLVVDTGSDDGGADWLARRADVSLWAARGDMRQARLGADWLNWLRSRHGHGHWTLTAAADEFLVYPFCDTRPLRALTDWLDDCGRSAFPAMQVDMYPRGALDTAPYVEGQDPFEIACWFDSGNYTVTRCPAYHHLEIRGGPRARLLCADDPAAAPVLDRIPLVKWERHFAAVQPCRMLLPRALNRTWDAHGGESISGALLRAALPGIGGDGPLRDVAISGTGEQEAVQARQGFWTGWSERYINWRQLEILGLMSKGNWA